MKFFGLLILTACASLGPQFKEVTANPKKALIYAYRPSRFAGSVWDHHIYIDNVKVGTLKSGSYFPVEVSPGDHILRQELSIDKFPEIKFTVAAGKTYYLYSDADVMNLETPYPNLGKKDERCPHSGPRINNHKVMMDYLEHLDTRAQKQTCRPGFMFVTELFAERAIGETQLFSK